MLVCGGQEYSLPGLGKNKIETQLATKRAWLKYCPLYLKPRSRPLSRPRRPFWGPLAAISDFEAFLTPSLPTKIYITNRHRNSEHGVPNLSHTEHLRFS